ncbi:MAG: hypothetical protein A2157_12655 [Deltaproteobacteria bacterium RBG_16_47_11]|nr:MAG: hypothetical protein A2157_12655 [Deltaproteobacteria bacterium RBG_16_47_11]
MITFFMIAFLRDADRSFLTSIGIWRLRQHEKLMEKSISSPLYEICEKVQKSLITLIRADYTDMKFIGKTGKSV